jgi:hypothetical protein
MHNGQVIAEAKNKKISERWRTRSRRRKWIRKQD